MYGWVSTHIPVALPPNPSGAKNRMAAGSGPLWVMSAKPFAAPLCQSTQRHRVRTAAFFTEIQTHFRADKPAGAGHKYGRFRWHNPGNYLHLGCQERLRPIFRLFPPFVSRIRSIYLKIDNMHIFNEIHGPFDQHAETGKAESLPLEASERFELMPAKPVKRGKLRFRNVS
jgi:hypothetical protein